MSIVFLWFGLQWIMTITKDILHREKCKNSKVATTPGTRFSFHSFVYLFIFLGHSMMTEVMTFVMKGWYQPGIPAVRVNRKSFAI